MRAIHLKYVHTTPEMFCLSTPFDSRLPSSVLKLHPTFNIDDKDMILTALALPPAATFSAISLQKKPRDWCSLDGGEKAYEAFNKAVDATSFILFML